MGDGRHYGVEGFNSAGGMLDRGGRMTAGIKLDWGGSGMSAAWDSERVISHFVAKFCPKTTNFFSN